MTTTSQSAPNEPSPKPVVRKRRRWGRALLIVAALLLILILLAPTLVTTLFKGTIESQINSRIQGSVSIDSLSAGWFSSAKADGLTLKDPDGNVVIDHASADTSLSLLHLISGWKKLGLVKLNADTINLVADKDGKLNLSEAIKPKPGHEAPPEPGSKKPSQVPDDITGEIQANVKTVNVKSPDTIATLTNLTTDVQLNQQAKPVGGGVAQVGFDVGTGVTNADGSQGSVKLNGYVDPFDNHQIKPLDQITGVAQGQISNFSMAVINPFLKGKVDLAGVLNSSLKMDAPNAGAGAVTLDPTITNFKVAGAQLKGDTLDLGTVTAPVDVSWKGGLISINKLNVATTTNLFNVAASGNTTADVLSAVTHGGAVPDSALNATMHADVAGLVNKLPHTLTLKEGMQLTGGSADGRLDYVVKAGQPDLQLHATVKDVAGKVTQNGQTRTVNAEPLALDAHVIRDNNTLRIPQALLAMPAGSGETLKMTVNQDPKDATHYSVPFTYDLGRLFAQAAQFADMTGKTFAGVGQANLDVKGDPNKEITYSFKNNTQNLKAVAAGKTIDEPTVSLASDGNIKMANNTADEITINSLTADTAVLHLKSSGINAKKNGNSYDVPAFDVNVGPANLNDVIAHYGSLMTLPETLKAAGMFDGAVLKGSLAGGVLKLEDAGASFSNLQLSNPQAKAAPFVDPKISMKAVGKVQLSPVVAEFSTLEVDSATKAFNFKTNKPLRYEASPMMVAADFQANSELPQLQNLLLALGKLAPGTQLKGSLAASGNISGDTTNTTVNLTANLPGLQMIPATGKAMPPTDVTAKIKGNADLAKKTFTFTEPGLVQEQDPATHLGDSVTLNQGDTFSWAAPVSFNVNGQLAYDISRLTGLLAASLPAGTTAEGKQTTDFMITGSLSDAPGFKKLENVQTNDITLAVAKASIPSYGIDMNQGTLILGINKAQGFYVKRFDAGANGGKVMVAAGHAKLSDEHPAFVFDTQQPIQLTQSVGLNQKLGAGPLAFLPILWGSSPQDTKVSGLVNVTLQPDAYIPLDWPTFQKTATMKGTVSVLQLTTNSPLFDILTSLIPGHGDRVGLQATDIKDVPFTLDHGKIHFENLGMKFATVGFVFGGDVGLDQSLNQRVAVSVAGLNAPIPIGIGGTVSHPTPKLDPGALLQLGVNLGTGAGKGLGQGANVIQQGLGGLLGGPKPAPAPAPQPNQPSPSPAQPSAPANTTQPAAQQPPPQQIVNDVFGLLNKKKHNAGQTQPAR